MYYAEYNCPVGKLLLVSDGEALTGLYMNRELPERTEELPVFFQVRRWLDAYFRGEEREIDFPMKAEGTPFQKLIWQMLLAIPFIRPNPDLWGAGKGSGSPDGERKNVRSGRGRRCEPQSHKYCDSVPPGYRCGWQAHRIRWWFGEQEMAFIP